MSANALHPEVQLKGKDFLKLADFTPEELAYLLTLSADLKARQKNGETFHPLKGKTLGMIFEKSSTRTRVSFEVGMYQLGGSALFLSSKDMQLGRGEPISDTAKVLSRYVDGIMIRTHSHEGIEELAHHATIPVINGLTDMYHPCQAVADLLTIQEHKNGLKGLKIAYVGDGNNVAHSLMIGAAMVGANIAVATPPGYECDAKVVDTARQIAQSSGSALSFTNDPVEAVSGADAIYTDVWASMGWESERDQRLQTFKDYQVNEKLVSHAKEDYIFLHCLPAHRGEEVSKEVIDGEHSVVFDQSENRLHVQKAIMTALMGQE